MYDENSFQNYIFWLKVKRVFLMIFFSILGAVVGIILNVLLIDGFSLLDAFFKPVIIAVSTLLFFGISLLLTANVGRDVQEGYWKMAVLRKLTVISKKLDALENLDGVENLNRTPQVANINEESVAPRAKATKPTKATKTPRKTSTKKATKPADDFEGFTVASNDSDQLFFQ